MTFTLDQPVDATGCMQQLPSVNGRLVAVPTVLQTGPRFDPASYGAFLRSFDFVAVDASGFTITNLATDASLNCIESENALPSVFSKGSKYRGFVLLDLPLDATSIGYVPTSADPGWEWNL
ncbi:MAG: hypothetical protein WBD41_21710 [Rhodococcus sp. (in: high G+C Gram-positive bacteria)]